MNALKEKAYLLEYGQSIEQPILGVFHHPQIDNLAHLASPSLTVKVIESTRPLKTIFQPNRFHPG